MNQTTQLRPILQPLQPDSPPSHSSTPIQPQPDTHPSHSSTPIPTPAQTQSHAQTIDSHTPIPINNSSQTMPTHLMVLVSRPATVNVVRSMWLFKHKFNADGSLSKYKARLVANRRSQQQGIDCDEKFSPVVKPATIHTVLSLAVSRDWPIHQLDVKNAFLHGHLSETVYMHQPPGFVDPNKPNYVCHLQRSLYGLKQHPRAWFQRFASYATRVGFQHSKTDSSLFVLRRLKYMESFSIKLHQICL
ncbi:ribonuclease H-like domain-containing protein [Tanacetum coccineum]